MRDQTDLERHVDPLHVNPAKHGYVRQPTTRLCSPLHASIEWGIVGADREQRQGRRVERSQARLGGVGLRGLSPTYAWWMTAGAGSFARRHFSLRQNLRRSMA